MRAPRPGGRAIAGLLAAVLAAACGGPLDRVRTPAPGPPPAAGVPGRVEVRADARVDLGYALVALARENDLVVDDEAPLTRAVRGEMSGLRDHPAVRGVQDLARSGLWTYPLIHALLAHGPLPELEPRAELPPEVLAALPGRDEAERRRNLAAWVDHVRDFARLAGFEAFLAAHREEREAQVEAILEMLGDEQPIALLEAYCGGSGFDRYLVHPSAFTRPEYGYGPSLATDEGRVAFHLAGRAVGQRPIDLMHLLLHEFGHSFVHRSVAGWPEAVAGAEKAFALVAPFMRAAHYPTWRIAFEEQLVEAVTARLLRQSFGPWATERVLVLADEVRGYSHVEPLARALRDYERRRGRYASLDEFVPAALDALTRAGDRTRWYGGADGFDENHARNMVRRVLRSIRRGDPTLLEDRIADGVNRGSLVFYLTRVLPQELGLVVTGEVSAELRTVRRRARGAAGDDGEGPGHSLAGRSTELIVATAHLTVSPGGGGAEALLRLTMTRDEPRRLVAAGARVYRRANRVE